MMIFLGFICARTGMRRRGLFVLSVTPRLVLLLLELILVEYSFLILIRGMSGSLAFPGLSQVSQVSIDLWYPSALAISPAQVSSRW
jgi:hypothetical protein